MEELVEEVGGVSWLTVAVLVEEAEGLLELGDLVVGELVRHGSPGEGSDGGSGDGQRERERERRSANGGSGREEATRRREDETRSQRPTGLVGSTRHLPVASSAPRGEHGPHLHVTNICISQIQQYYLHPEI